MIDVEGKKTTAPRYMCEVSHGLPPSDAHDAAHSCGQGHNGCINPKHLRWATRTENNNDKIIHGTIMRGEMVPTSRLTAQDVLSIRELASSHSGRQIAEMFGIGQATVQHILHRRTWAWLK